MPPDTAGSLDGTVLSSRRISRRTGRTAPGSLGDRSVSSDSLNALFETDSPPIDIGVGSGSVAGALVGSGEQALPADGEQPRYEVRGELGRGGMGVVDLVFDHELRREVARKRLNSGGSRDTAARFVEEGQITGQLEHPNIVPVHDMGVDAAGRLFITLKRVKGRSLRQLINATRLEVEDNASVGSFTLQRRLDIFRKVLDAVAYAHNRGVIHRDLKPDNIMVGEFGEVLVMDWGLARIVGLPERIRAVGERVQPDTRQQVESHRSDTESAMTMVGHMLGTPGYMPIEQARGDRELIDHRADIHALGVILYELLTLTNPFSGETTLARLQQMYRGRIDRARDKVVSEFGANARLLEVVPELEAIARRAMQREIEDRYRTTQEMASDVDAWREHRNVTAYRAPLRRRIVRFARRYPAAAVGMLAAAALLVVVSVFVVQLAGEHEEMVRQRGEAILASQQAEAYSVVAEERAELAEQARSRAVVAEQDALASLDTALDFRVSHALAGDDALTAIAMLAGRQDVGAMAGRFAVPPPGFQWIMGRQLDGICLTCACMPDGQSVLVALSWPGGMRSNLRVIDARTGEERSRLEVDNMPMRVNSSPDDNPRIAVGFDTGEVGWLDPGSMKLGWRQKLATMPINDVAISPGGRYAAGASADWTSRLFNAAGPRVDGNWVIPTENYGSATAWTADGRFLVAGTVDGRFWVLRLEDGALMQIQFGSDIKDIVHVNIGINGAPEKDLLAVLTSDSLQAVDPAEFDAALDSLHDDNPDTNFQVAQTLVRKVHSAAAIAVSPDSQILVIAEGSVGRIMMIDYRAGEPAVSSMEDAHARNISTLAFSPDGRFFTSASSDGWLNTWAVMPSTSTRLKSTELQWGRAVFSPDGARLAVGLRNGKVAIHDVATRMLLTSIRTRSSSIRGMSWQPDGLLVTVGYEGIVEAWRSTNAAGTAWKRERYFEPPAATVDVSHAAVLRQPGSDEFLVAIQYFTRIDMVRTTPSGGELLWTLMPEENSAPFNFSGIAPLHSGQALVVGLGFGAIRLVDAATGKIIGKWGENSARSAHALIVSPDDTWVASEVGNSQLAFWPLDRPEAQPLRKIDAQVDDGIGDMAMTPDGRILAVSDARRIILFDLNNGHVLRRMELGSHSLVFSPDGQLMAAESWRDNQTHLLGHWATTNVELAERVTGRHRDRFVLLSLTDAERMERSARWAYPPAILSFPDTAAASFWRLAWDAARDRSRGAIAEFRRWLATNTTHALAELGKRVSDTLDKPDREAALSALRDY